jgi:ketosteroid isomerase-like protein
LFDAVDRGDPAAALELIHPDGVWSPTVWSGSGTTHRDAAGVRGWFAQFGPRLENLSIDVAEIAQRSGWVVVLGTVHDNRNETPFTTRVGWTFAVEDGRVIEGRAYESWEEARRAGGLEDPPQSSNSA